MERPTSHPSGSLLPVAPPVDGLNVVRVVVPQSATHATRADVVGVDVAVIRELLPAQGTLAMLQGDLAIHQLPHLRVRAEFAVTARMLWIIDAADTNVANSPPFG